MILSSFSSHEALDRATDDVPRAVVLLEIAEDGTLIVDAGQGNVHRCRWLETGGNSGVLLERGDLLAATRIGSAGWVVLGRIGRYVTPSDDSKVILSAKETLSIQCGDSSLTLHADGKVLIKGEDIVLRAKGTQRIRAGTVAIN